MLTRLIAILLLIASYSTPALAHGSAPLHSANRAGIADAPRIVGHTTPRAISSADAARYAAREAASPGAKRYRGGDAVIYVSTAAAVLIVCIILLIVLL